MAAQTDNIMQHGSRLKEEGPGLEDKDDVRMMEMMGEKNHEQRVFNRTQRVAK